ncbi:hypothetical protein [Bosea beijingensis]|uniref:hypothetical protein n=1 Tax=Bosea beijingensis TaxID=3068632 RepID=UPI0027404A57|nr:hypothetical protein [Bosea sp. REN20]
MRKLLTLAALGIGLSLAAPAMASEELPAAMAQRLDKQDAEYTWSAAAERRHMIMRETMRQQRYGRGGGYGYGPRRGYGPGYGYGPRGYGPPPGYYRRNRGW